MPPGNRLSYVSVRIPAEVRDAIDRQAIRERKSTSALVRQILQGIFKVQKLPVTP